MSDDFDTVPGGALDHHEIFRRGGQNCGNEDYYLCKCPHCGRIYLIEYEAETLFPDPDDLSRRADILSGPKFICEGCGEQFPQGAWIGPKAPASMRVCWEDLAASPWRWITARTRESHQTPDS
jgi:hypothetical protein